MKFSFYSWLLLIGSSLVLSMPMGEREFLAQFDKKVAQGRDINYARYHEARQRYLTTGRSQGSTWRPERYKALKTKLSDSPEFQKVHEGNQQRLIEEAKKIALELHPELEKKPPLDSTLPLGKQPASSIAERVEPKIQGNPQPAGLDRGKEALASVTETIKKPMNALPEAPSNPDVPARPPPQVEPPKTPQAPPRPDPLPQVEPRKSPQAPLRSDPLPRAELPKYPQIHHKPDPLPRVETLRALDSSTGATKPVRNTRLRPGVGKAAAAAALTTLAIGGTALLISKKT